MADDVPCLHVCVTCRAGRELAEGEVPPGALLHAEIVSQVAARAVEMTVREVRCLSSCQRGCAVGIAMPGKWSYLLGDLTPAQVPDLLAYCASYAASSTGTVLPSRRAASLKTAIVARFPAAAMAQPETAS